MTRITHISFRYYKALESFSISLDQVNILTGANNAGKSTVISALRVLSVAIRSARSRGPERIQLGRDRYVGYRISSKVIPISLENVTTNYGDERPEIAFRLSNKNRLTLIFDQEVGCVLVPEVSGATIISAALFKVHFPIELVVVPVLGPLEGKEKLLTEETVQTSLDTPRAARHFRNFWYRNLEQFEKFSGLLAATWPGMRIKAPELDSQSGILAMFVSEDRIDRELFWVGFGFQVWCQLLTHLIRAGSNSLVVIDEPEIYLHPDTQRRLSGVIKSLGPDVLIASHSTEIIAEADPADIILIDKRKGTAERLKDIAGVQRAMNVLGSQQNISLTALARHRRVIFVEGISDFQILRRFAKRIGLDDLSTGEGLAAMPSGGFGSWKRISILSEGIGEALGAELMIAAIYDRDYYCDEEIESVLDALNSSLHLAHVHRRKEIENYLLVPDAIERAIKRGIDDKILLGDIPASSVVPVSQLLADITLELEDDCFAQYLARYSNYYKGIGQKHDTATYTKEAMKIFRGRWAALENRLLIVPGKAVLSRLRQKLAELYGISVSDYKIIDSMRQAEIAPDLKDLLFAMNEFRTQK